MERQVGAVTIEDVALPARLRLQGHSHASAHLCVVLAGGFSERCGPRDEWCGQGRARVSPPGDVHDLSAGPAGARCLLVTVDPTHTFHQELLHPRRRTFVPAGRLDRTIQSLLRHCAPGIAPAALDVELTVLEAFTLGSRLRARVDAPRLARVHSMVHEHGETSLERLAAEAALHPVYLARAFRRRYGCSIGAYARRIRAERARYLLAGSSLSIARVASECGYADQSHLTRALRSMLGVTPGDLRRQVVRRLQDGHPGSS